jgi:hypothetical protein
VRAEREPAGVRPGQAYRISDIELASRLSFFLWSSIPDEQLITLATQGRLGQPQVLANQVRRMLRDSRADAMVSNFGQQFLYLRNLPGTSPDGLFYPNWDDELRQAFKRESELFFDSIIREDHNVVDLLTADYTFVNERLARQYGISNVYGSRFRRVTLPPEMDYRRGLLGKGSFLAVTWTQNFRTSPVKRGAWVLENILGTPPPEPPPNVPPLEDTKSDSGKTLTLREQMTLSSGEPALRRLPQDHGPDRVRARKPRCRRPMALEAGRRRWCADRRQGQAVRRTGRRRPGWPAYGAAALLAAVRADVHREADDLRARPRARLHRYADPARDYPGCRT